MYDVAVIGGGVVGGMIARALAKYRLRICILEKENDVCMGATKANSAIVHAGFDAQEGSLKAKLNVRGSEMMPDICAQLGVKYQNNGALVLAFCEEDRKMLTALLARGQKNGVKDLRIVEQSELRQMEPNISKQAVCALYAPTGAIVCPYGLGIAAIGNAMDNGAHLICNFEVTGMQKTQDGYRVLSGEQSVKTRFVINAAGLFADKIAAMVGDTSFTVHPRRGEYILFDKELGQHVTHTIFRTPTKMGKGILVTPTVDGNLLAGPTSVDIEDKTDHATTAEGLARIKQEALKSVEGLAFGKGITTFCGLRAVGDTGDFIIRSPKEGFIHVAGIESPGLSASPAIAEYVVELLKAQGLPLIEKENYCEVRKPMYAFHEADMAEKNEIIKQNPAYGRIVCRCEGITEGEIVEAIRQNPPARDLDGVKRRTRAQMGRCQGGFCSPQIVEILAKELGISPLAVTKNGGASLVNIGRTKEER